METKQTSLEIVRDCLKTALELDDLETSAVDTDTTAWGLEKWTSLSHQALILELENRLGIEFDVLEIVDLVSVKAILEAFERNGK
jgi:acyl carrier protein